MAGEKPTDVKCTYSQLAASAKPRCCVSFSSFCSDIITPCPSCACACQNENNCVISGSKITSKVEMNTTIEDAELKLKCTQHMCPIRVHWHVKANYVQGVLACEDCHYQFHLQNEDCPSAASKSQQCCPSLQLCVQAASPIQIH
ncbi:hypothetical protein VitviT2T_026029 [Vitis vinifera]|nr:hypothetical protein VitviT2T_026029 [Vitis vinifera]